VQSGHEQNITLIMIVVILVFMLCNAPARLVQVCSLRSRAVASVTVCLSVCVSAFHGRI